MKTNDINTRDELMQKMQQAAKENKNEEFFQYFAQLFELVEASVEEKNADTVKAMREETDRQIMANRGKRMMTSAEKDYYEKVCEAMKSENPQQALANLSIVMPETVIDETLEELRQDHPLLQELDFVQTRGAIRWLMNTDGFQKAVWGKLCDEITKELSSGFKEVDTNLLKLSAFLPVCKAMLDLGPEWLDRYVREVLYEALANGLEEGIVNGTGKDMPIGMNRDTSDTAQVVGGVYPKKAKIKLKSLSPANIGKLLAMLAISPNGKARRIENVVFIVNQQDYLEKIFPATTVQAPDGTYRNNVLPYPMKTIPVVDGLNRGEAIIGLGRRYFAAVGMPKNGKIEYSDHYRFLEDERVYDIKLYAQGMPKDENAFLFLDISDLKPTAWKVEQVEGAAEGTNAKLASMRIGSLGLDPDFDADTTSYEVETTNATNVVTAVPADASASVAISVNGAQIDNGRSATWQNGENTVTIVVTAEDGTTTKTYTVAVTKA